MLPKELVSISALIQQQQAPFSLAKKWRETLVKRQNVNSYFNNNTAFKLRELARQVSIDETQKEIESSRAAIGPC